MIKKIRALSLHMKILLFILLLIIWFLIANNINENIENPIERSVNLNNLWMLSGLYIGLLWIIFFPKRKGGDEKMEE